MNPCPVITGIGLITPLGGSACTTWDTLLAGRYVATHAKVSLNSAQNLPHVTALALAAAHEALSSASEQSRSRDAALVVGSSKGPVESWLSSGDTRLGLGSLASDLARKLNIHGPRLTISGACASGLQALVRAALMIRSGEARRVLVVAAEASVHPLFLGSFRRLGVLASEEIGCRPFDEARQGFIMSEAAAAVCLESEESSEGNVMLDHCFLGADATHLTGTDPEARTLRRALQKITTGGGVDLFHAHGTGTRLNDEAELSAIDEQSANATPPPHVYSHKGALGHSLGAAGLVSVVLNVMMHRLGIVLPNVRTTRPMAARNVRLSSEPARRPIRRSVITAAGFGGPVAAVTLQTCSS